MAKLSRGFVFLLTAALFLTVVPAPARDARIDQVLNQLEQVHPFSAVSISPDGKWVTWTQPASSDTEDTEIFLLHWGDAAAKPTRITAGNGTQSLREHAVAWSPDSSQIAFFSNANSSQDQLFVLAVSGGKARALTNVQGHVTDIRWSPDGKEIAFLYAEHGGGGGPLEAEPAAVGVIGGSMHNQRLTIVNAAGGEIHQVSPADLNIYEYGWSPDGKQFAAIAAPGPADNNWWIAKLYTVDKASGQMKVLYQPPPEQQIAVPRWSPDGKQIAFIGGLMSDEGFDGGDIFAVSSEGGAAKDLTPGIHASPSGFVWQDAGKLIFTETVEGGGAISSLDIATGQTETLWKGSESIHHDGNFPNFSLAKRWTDKRRYPQHLAAAARDFRGPDWRMAATHSRERRPAATLGKSGERRLEQR